jgi:hypothetical protein
MNDFLTTVDFVVGLVEVRITNAKITFSNFKQSKVPVVFAVASSQNSGGPLLTPLDYGYITIRSIVPILEDIGDMPRRPNELPVAAAEENARSVAVTVGQNNGIAIELLGVRNFSADR